MNNVKSINDIKKKIEKNNKILYHCDDFSLDRDRFTKRDVVFAINTALEWVLDEETVKD